MTTLVFDIETNGLLPWSDGGGKEATKLFCIVIGDMQDGTTTVYRDTRGFLEATARLSSAETIVGHNIISYDIPALAFLGFPLWSGNFSVRLHAKVRDTLLLGKLVEPDLKNKEFELHRKKQLRVEPKLLGRHSLEAWAQRIGGKQKDSFGGTVTDWSTVEWSAELEEYCVRDVEATMELFKFLSHELSTRPTGAVELEHAFAILMQHQEERGFRFDEVEAKRLYIDLHQKRQEIATEIKTFFPPWEQTKDVFTPKRDNKKLGYIKGVPIERKELVEFNPDSRDHIANRLTCLRGWKPKEFTDKGKPKIDEKVLKTLKYPEAALLSSYLLLSKRISQLADGKQALLGSVFNGRIHGRVDTLGTVTGRCSHRQPNMAQVPAVYSKWGREFRGLLKPSPGMVLVGADASGLELRCLAHFMAVFDNGDYAETVVNGDVHTKNQEAAGLPTRDEAKTFIYGFLYGAGDPLLGSFVGGGRKEGKLLRERFLKSLPALNKLITRVQQAAGRGFLVGLDGRHLPVRSPHAALNVLLQSAGALVMKKAGVIVGEQLEELGEAFMVANIHDEFQIETTKEKAELVGRMAVDAIRRAGEYFKFRCPLNGEYKIGSSWAETH